MCERPGHFRFYNIYPDSYSCNPCPFYPSPSGLIRPSDNPLRAYLEAYKVGADRARREK